MTTEDDDTGVADWLKPMLRPPLKIEKDTTPEDITDELEERLRSLLAHHSCCFGGGWREVALRLLLSHEPAFQIVSPLDRPKNKKGKEKGGADPSVLRWGLVGSIKKLVERDKMSNNDAARLLSKERKRLKQKGVSEGTLRNLLSLHAQGKIKPPRFVQRWKYEGVAEKALRAAAERIDASQ